MKAQPTTIAEFAHPDTSSEIAIVGNRHYGSEGYMQELKSRLAHYRADGATIHFEGVSLLTDNEKALLTKSQLRSYVGLRQLLDFGERLHEGRGFARVQTIIESSEEWEWHDTTSYDLMTRASMKQRLTMGAMGVIVSLASSATDINTLYEAIYENEAIDKDPSRISKAMSNAINPLIVDYRNNIALGAVDTSLTVAPSQNLALLWGDGHVAGLSEGLRIRGYELVSTETLDPFQ